MSNKSIIHRPVSEILSNDQSREDLSNMAKQLTRYRVGKRTLAPEEAATFALFCYYGELNPWVGDAYWIDKVGPTLGINAVRRKAQEQLSRELGGNAGSIEIVEQRDAHDYEAEFDPAQGDIAKFVAITTSRDKAEWKAAYLEVFRELRDGGLDAKLADERAMMIAGKMPVWTGVGVVGGDEHFSGYEWDDKKNKPKTDENGDVIYKQEMWDRNERALKRAEKNAIKKKYPTTFYFEEQALQADPEIQELIRVVEQNIQQGQLESEIRSKEYSDDDYLNTMGFETETPVEETKAKDKSIKRKAQAQVIEGTEVKPEKPKAAPGRPYDPETWKQGILKLAGELTPDARHVGVAARQLEMILGGKTQRYELTTWLTGQGSLKDNPVEGIASALCESMNTWGFDTPPHDVAMKEVKQAHQYALKDMGQMEMEIEKGDTQ